MATTVKLKDQTEVVIRPMTEGDLDRSFDFFQALPEEDRAYLRADVTRRGVVERRLLTIRSERFRRLVAVSGEEIVADGALELCGQGWKEHVGELSLIVARPYRRKGLGALMARELYILAAGERVEEMVVKMMKPQVAGRSIFRRLGFQEAVVVPEYVKDVGGRRQDLLVMRCDLKALWRELENYFIDSDWPLAR